MRRLVGGFTIGPLVSVLLGLLTVPALAWLFPPEAIGLVEILTLTLVQTGLVLSLGLDKSLLSEYHHATDPAVLVRISLLPALAGYLLFAAGISLVAEPLGRMIFADQLPHWQIFVQVGAASLLLQRFLNQLLKLQEAGAIFSAAQLIPKVVFLFALPLLALLPARGVFELAVLSVLAHGLTALFLIFSQRTLLLAALRSRSSLAAMRLHVQRGLPFLAFGGLYLAMLATGSWVLRYASTLNELGQYALTLRIAAAAALAQGIFSSIWLPLAYRRAAAGDTLPEVETLSRRMAVVVVLLFCMTGAMAPLLQPLLPIAYHPALCLLVAAVGQPLLHALAEVTGIGINLSRRTLVSVLAAGMGLLVNLGLALILVPDLGARGAVVGTLCGFYCYFVLRTEFANRIWRRFPRTRLHAVVGAVVLLAATSAVLDQPNDLWFPSIWLGLGLIIVWHFWSELRAVFRLIWHPT